MLQNGPLYISWAHFLGWDQKCLKTLLRELPGLTFWAGARNASKMSSGGLLGSLSGLGPEMLQNGSLETSWAHFLGWGQKCFKTVLWKPPGLAFWAGARNASKLFSGGLLGSLSGLGPEMLQNGLLETSWAHFLVSVSQSIVQISFRLKLFRLNVISLLFVHSNVCLL